MNIVEKIESLCKENKISVTALEAGLGCGRGAIRQWNTRRPRAELIGRVADYFGVSSDWLLGLSESRFRVDKMFEKDIITIQRAREKMNDKDKARMMQLPRIGFEDAFNEEE